MINNSMSTALIEAIISRNEFLELKDSIDNKDKLILISISEPDHDGYDDEELTNADIIGFKDVIRIKFWDIEEDFGNYKTISDEQGLELQEFILKHIEDTFLIHCRAGQSRSAGVGKAVECLKYFGVGDAAKYNYQTGFTSEIDQHPRYTPNLTVFDKIIQKGK